MPLTPSECRRGSTASGVGNSALASVVGAFATQPVFTDTAVSSITKAFADVGAKPAFSGTLASMAGMAFATKPARAETAVSSITKAFADVATKPIFTQTLAAIGSETFASTVFRDTYRWTLSEGGRLHSTPLLSGSLLDAISRDDDRCCSAVSAEDPDVIQVRLRRAWANSSFIEQLAFIWAAWLMIVLTVHCARAAVDPSVPFSPVNRLLASGENIFENLMATAIGAAIAVRAGQRR